MEQIIDLRNTLRYLGVPIEGRSYMFGDNEMVVNTASTPHGRLHKRHNALAFHKTRWCIAAKVAWFTHIGEIPILLTSSASIGTTQVYGASSGLCCSGREIRVMWSRRTEIGKKGRRRPRSLKTRKSLRSRPSSRGVKDGRFQSCRDSSSRAPDSLRGRYIRGFHANARQPVESHVFRSRDLYTIGQSVFQSLSWAPRCEACCEDVE